MSDRINISIEVMINVTYCASCWVFKIKILEIEIINYIVLLYE